MSSSGGISTASTTGHGVSSITKNDVELPSIRDLLTDLPDFSSSLASRTETIDLEKQQEMFRGLREIIEKAQPDEAGDSFDLKQLHSSLEEADASSKAGRRNAETLKSVHDTLHRLWACESEYLVQATEIIANGSRDRESVNGYINSNMY
jgi:hypothetical protein